MNFYLFYYEQIIFIYFSLSIFAEGCSTTYSQCGGITWTGSTQCCSGSQCQYNSLYYSQCLPISGASTSSSSTVQASTSSSSTVQASTSSGATAQSSTISAGNDGRTDGITTRYWDCCKASCAWTGKASVTSPVKTCLADGITSADVNAQSGCNGGSAYMCNNQQPWNVSATLSYGYAAAYISVSDYLFFVLNKIDIYIYYYRVKENPIGVVLAIHWYLQQLLLLVKN